MIRLFRDAQDADQIQKVILLKEVSRRDDDGDGVEEFSFNLHWFNESLLSHLHLAKRPDLALFEFIK